MYFVYAALLPGDILESIVAEPVSYPYIQAVRPLAIVAGEQNTLVLKGFNFTQPGTRYTKMMQ
jgi:hypothetical protein